MAKQWCCCSVCRELCAWKTYSIQSKWRKKGTTVPDHKPQPGVDGKCWFGPVCWRMMVSCQQNGRRWLVDNRFTPPAGGAGAFTIYWFISPDGKPERSEECFSNGVPWLLRVRKLEEAILCVLFLFMFGTGSTLHHQRTEKPNLQQL